VFPYDPEIHLDAEDGVSLEDRDSYAGPSSSTATAVAEVAVIALPHISNFTDFALLGRVPFLRAVPDERFHTIIIPGTKSTIEDLRWLRSTGLAEWILAEHGRGARVVGVCGGFQMLGETVRDPDGVESTGNGDSVPGLGLLRVHTTMVGEKTTRPVEARTPSGLRFSAYEIHMGQTTRPADSRPFAFLDDGTTDGIRNERVLGTYLHGAFENPRVLEETLMVDLGEAGRATGRNHYDRLARWFAENANLEAFGREFM
jgi:adenosylcobyric acid synthase